MIYLNSIAIFEEDEILDTINKMVGVINTQQEVINDLQNKFEDKDEVQHLSIIEPLNNEKGLVTKVNELINYINKEVV